MAPMKPLLRPMSRKRTQSAPIVAAHVATPWNTIAFRQLPSTLPSTLRYSLPRGTVVRTRGITAPVPDEGRARLMKPLIVHLSADYPDAWQPRKTRAVAALIEGTAGTFDHRVYSLNRVNGGWKGIASAGAVTPVADDGQVASWTYAQPPGGILLATAMRRVGDAIVADIRERGLRPALVQGHKLSIEGIAARLVAARLEIPYALTLQGNTDQKIIGLRRDMEPRYRRVWRDAAAIAAFAPWIADWCAARLGKPAAPPIALPCVPATDRVIAPRDTGPRIVTAFHLDHWRNKNVAALARACAIVRGAAPEATLEIAGQGEPAAERAVDRIIAQSGIGAAARRVGHIGDGGLQDWMNGAAVFVMPSKRESFGMVFIEALLAGCPIVYPRGAAVDGFFDGAPFAIGVDARSPERIAEAIACLLRETDERKAALAQWQASGAMERFRRERILRDYATLIEGAIA